MPKKDFVWFHLSLALSILLNTVTGVLFMQNIYGYPILPWIHRISGTVILLVMGLMVTTKKGRSASKVFTAMSKPRYQELKKGNYLTFGFKLVNLVFVSLLFVQLASGLSLSTGLFYRPWILSVHRMATPALILMVLLHAIYATVFNRNIKNRNTVKKMATNT
jgi:hypothetical protein